MQPIDIYIKNRLYGKGKGWSFTPKDFEDLGTPPSIRRCLTLLTRQGLIRRLAQGLYDYPRTHRVLGELPPDIAQVAQALAREFAIRIQPAGAYAANQLGLSEQVPARYVFLTDGSTKSIQLEHTTIQLKKTTPRRMKTAGRISGTVFEALRSFGKDNITPELVARLRKRLTAEDRKRLHLDAHLAPAWIAALLRREKLDDHTH